MEKSKQFILDLLAAGKKIDKNRNLRQLSRDLGMNDAYLQQYIRRGSPRKLPEAVRYKLAQVLGTDECYLREDFWQAEAQKPQALAPIQSVPQLEPKADDPFSVQYFARTELLNLVPKEALPYLRITVITDDSMAPELPAGTVVMVNLADKTIPQPPSNPFSDHVSMLKDAPKSKHVSKSEHALLSEDAPMPSNPQNSKPSTNAQTGSERPLFLFRTEQELTLRYVSHIQTENTETDLIRLSANNPDFGSIRIPKTHIQPIGRVIWYARSLV